MNDVKTAMQMNILLFIREVFEYSPQGLIKEEVIQFVFPVLMKLLFNGKNFIKEHTKITVQIISENFPCNSLFSALGETTLQASTTNQVYVCVSILLHVIQKLG